MDGSHRAVAACNHGVWPGLLNVWVGCGVGVNAYEIIDFVCLCVNHFLQLPGGGGKPGTIIAQLHNLGVDCGDDVGRVLDCQADFAVTDVSS